MGKSITGDKPKSILEDYFGPKVERLSTRNLSKELILLGNNKEAHSKDLVNIDKRRKYDFLVKECRKRDNYVLKELISNLHKQHTEDGPKINYQKKYNVDLSSYKGISWGDL